MKIKAAMCREFGTPVKIEDVEPPALRAGAVRIRVALG